MALLDGKRILITGGTGSLGKVLLRRLLSGQNGDPSRIVIFSRDEAKQHDIRVYYQHRRAATDEIIYRNFREKLEFRIGDVRDYGSLCGALHDIDIVFAAAALKQVPTCEYFPAEAVNTNVLGATNLVRAIRDLRLPVECVMGISTDKAVKPVNVMGMTKSLQERIYAQGNLEAPDTRFVLSRYGNVLASRGSVIPLFHDQIRNGGPLTITSPEMTRFLLSLEEAVDLILRAIDTGKRGETYIPRVPSARMTDVAAALIGDRPIQTVVTGVRPGEKLHEILVSEEEGWRTFERGQDYVVAPILPELREEPQQELTRCLEREYSSQDDLMSLQQVTDLLRLRGLMPDQELRFEDEVLV
jgi:FlaA1/EpsC-like NDP-sugar epimerase